MPKSHKRFPDAMVLKARKRVVMKRRLRKAKIPVPSNISTKLLRMMYKIKFGKAGLNKIDRMTLRSRYP